MCDHQAFKPSARGNMNVPFFQNHLHCGITYHERSLSPLSWNTPEDWVQSTQLHENKPNPPASPPGMQGLHQAYHVATEIDQHDLALALCVDDCGECDDPTCSEPDCEADLIECTEASCSQPPVPGACHGNNTLCAGNLPADVLNGAVSLAALKPTSSSYGHMFTPQPTEQDMPLCVAIAGGYYNPDHIHPHLPQCGPHTYSNVYDDQSMFDGSMIPQNIATANGFTFGSSSQMCQYPEMYYNIGAQTVSQFPHQQQQISVKEEISRSTISPGPQQSFHFSEESAPSTTSSFSSPIHRSSVSICENSQMQQPSITESHLLRPTCRWEIGHDMICGCAFDDKAQLQIHIQQVHTASLRKVHGFKCQWKGCPRRMKGGESFAQRSKLDRHIQSHTGYKASICTICGQQFSTTQSLVLHQRTHSGEKPHKCKFPGCDYAAAQASQLTMHNRTKHTKEKPLKCDFPGCNARFAESSNLSKHKKIHLPEAQCTCQVCFKSFSRDDQLKRHMKTHTRKDNGRSASVSSIGQYGGFEFSSLKMEGEAR